MLMLHPYLQMNVFIVYSEGLEPSTQALKVLCATTAPRVLIQLYYILYYPLRYTAEMLGSDPNPPKWTICLAGSPYSSQVAISKNSL